MTSSFIMTGLLPQSFACLSRANIRHLVIFLSASKMMRILFVFLLIATGQAWAGKQDVRVAYIPGLGEIMSLTQARHVKLWLAAQEQNWPLASYELDELKEGLDDAIKFHPRHKTVPQPLSKIIPALLNQPLSRIAQAIEAKDNLAFTQGYDKLTEACNTCHKTSGFGFITVNKPAPGVIR
jgi:hypothetical protein